MVQSIYIKHQQSGKLDEVEQELFNKLKRCNLCPRNCEVNRLNNEIGVCKTGRYAKIASYGPHFGEEYCLVGKNGSGTIFFSHCNLLYSFCQNYDISHEGYGSEMTEEQIAEIMIELQERGCHNINLVSPSHVISQIFRAVRIACLKGLHIPVVYNTGGYDSVQSLKYLAYITDIYMPDFKFSNANIAAKTCNAPHYFDVAKVAIREMHRQAGNLQTNAQGIAIKGLIIRHLVMPNDVCGTEKIMDFIANDLSKASFINMMQQYRPCGTVHAITELNRPITQNEYKHAVNTAKRKGLIRIKTT